MVNRTTGRNVLIYDRQDPDTIIGGLVATYGMTDAHLYSIVDIALKFSESYSLRLKTGKTIQREEKPL